MTHISQPPNRCKVRRVHTRIHRKCVGSYISIICVISSKNAHRAKSLTHIELDIYTKIQLQVIIFLYLWDSLAGSFSFGGSYLGKRLSEKANNASSTKWPPHSVGIKHGRKSSTHHGCASSLDDQLLRRLVYEIGLYFNADRAYSFL